MHVNFLGQFRGQPQWQKTRWSSFRSWPASSQHRWTHQACRTSRWHSLLHWPYPLQQRSPKQVNLEARQARGQRSSTVWGALSSAKSDMPILFSSTVIHTTGVAKETRSGMPSLISPRADVHLDRCSGVAGHPHGEMMRSTWPGHTKRAQSSFNRAQVTVIPDLVVAARIDRNRASAVYRRPASKAYNDRWYALCEKANISTADFWHFHHSLDKRLPSPRLVLYDDNGTPLVTDQQQGEAFLHRFIQQSNECDLEERQYLLGQLNDLCRTTSAPQPITVAEVTNAVRSSKDGSPSSDCIKVDELKHRPDNTTAVLTDLHNNSLHCGKVPEVWTDAFIGPVPKPTKDHKCLKGHRIIVVQNVIGKIPEKVAARRFTRHSIWIGQGIVIVCVIS